MSYVYLGPRAAKVDLVNHFQKESYVEVTSSDSMLLLLPLLLFRPEPVNGLRRGAERSIGKLFFFLLVSSIATAEIKVISFFCSESA